MAEELFGLVKEDKKEDKSFKEKIENLSEVQKSATEKLIHEYHGFEFDVERMSELVTGKKRPGFSDELIKKEEKKRDDVIKEILEVKEMVEGAKEIVEGALETGLPTDEKIPTKKMTQSEYLQHLDSTDPAKSNTISEIKSGAHKDLIKKTLNSNVNRSSIPTIPGGFPDLFNGGIQNIVPSSKNMIKYKKVITPAKREELAFFLGKLNVGISNLGKGEKNINYRHSKDDNYIFTYEKNKKDKNDFSLKFDIDLNVKTKKANINLFEFDVDAFKFDSSFFELIDVVKALDLVGMNLSHYIEEITGVNSPAPKKRKKLTKKSNKKVIRANTKIETLIDDKKIVTALNNNDIAYYRDLKRFSDDFTVLKGIGAKTADKIKNYLKR